LTRILVSSAGGKVPLVEGLSKSLRGSFSNPQIVVADTSADSLSFYFADEKHIVLPATQENLKWHLDFCQTKDIQLVIPTRDGELAFWASNEDSFRKIGVRVAISSSKTISSCSDKELFFQILNSQNLPAIPTSTAVDALPSGRYVVKERFGSASNNIGLNLISEDAISRAKELVSPVFQPYICGVEYSVDVWRSQLGDVTICSPRTRDLIIDGEAKVTSTVRHPDLELLSEKLAELLDIKGIAVMQFIVDEQGRIWVIECNARTGGASTASVAAGAPLFELVALDFLDFDYKDLVNSITIKSITQVRAQKDFIFQK
jgi:carbamoyl-phosphate synthase large subunit